MLRVDEDAVLCDFAETYHIYDIYQLPCRYVSALAAGLRDDSRIRQKLSGLRVTPEVLALALCADAARTLVWFQTKDGRKGRNRPASVYSLFSGETEKKNIRSYQSGEEFMAARDEILRQIKEGEHGN